MPSQGKSEERRALRRDKAGNAIPGGSGINGVINQAVDNTSWTAVVMPAGRNCKQIVIQERGGGAFKIAHESDGDPYFSVAASAALSMEIAADAGERLFYAQMAAGSGTIEVLLVD